MHAYVYFKLRVYMCPVVMIYIIIHMYVYNKIIKAFHKSLIS